MPKKRAKSPAIPEEDVNTITQAVIISTENVLKAILIRFLTINFYKYLLNDLYLLTKYEIYIYICELDAIDKYFNSSEIIRNKLINEIDKINSKAKNLLMNKNFKSFFLHHYRTVLNRDVLLMQKCLLHDIEFKLLNIAEQKFLSKEIKVTGKTDQFNSMFQMKLLKRANAVYNQHSSLLIILSKLYCTKVYCPNMIYVKDPPKAKRTIIGLAKTDKTCVNKFVKSITGYFGAFGFIWMLYMYLRYQYETEVTHGIAIICSLSIFILFGLTFSSTLRAYILMIIPFFGTLQGRLILLAFATELCVRKLYPSITSNYAAFQFAYKCTRRVFVDQLALFKDKDGPFGHINRALEDLEKQCNAVIKAIKTITDFIKELIPIIKKVVKILMSILSICDDSFGKPLILCMSGINELVNYCLDESYYNIACYLIPALLSPLCMFFQYLSILCFLFKFLFRLIARVIQSVAKAIWNSVLKHIYIKFRDTLWFSVSSSTDINFGKQRDETFKSIATNIGSELRQHTGYLISLINDLDYLFPVAIITIIIGSWRYKRKYMSNAKYDNFTIGVHFEKMDHQRFMRGYRTLLPLKRRLRRKYVKLLAVRQTKSEIRATTAAIIMFFTSFIPIVVTVLIDLFLIHLNRFLKKHLLVSITYQDPSGSMNNMQLNVEGRGFVANVYRMIFQKFRVITQQNITIDTTLCFPSVIDGNEDTYEQIGYYLLILFCMSCFQAYMQRLRSVFMGAIYPLRDQERAIWLYNHIMVYERSVLSFSFNPKKDMTRKYVPPYNGCWKHLGKCLWWLLKNLVEFIIWAIYYVIHKIIMLIYSIIMGIIELILIFFGSAWYFCKTACPCLMAVDTCCKVCSICCNIYCKILKKVAIFFLKPVLVALKHIWAQIVVVVTFVMGLLCSSCGCGRSVSCDFCLQRNIGLNFQVCLKESCNKCYCFDCFRRFNQECPFCILNSKMDDDDRFNESIEVDSSVDEEEKSDLQIQLQIDDANDEIDDEKQKDNEDEMIKKKLENATNEEKEEQEDNDEISVSGIEKAIDGCIFRPQDYVSDFNSSYSKIYLRALTKIKGATFKQTVTRMKKNDIDTIIDAEFNAVVQYFQDERYLPVLENIQALVIDNKKVKGIFENYTLDLYNQIHEDIFDNIVEEIQNNEFFDAKLLKKSKFHREIKEVHNDVTDS